MPGAPFPGGPLSTCSSRPAPRCRADASPGLREPRTADVHVSTPQAESSACSGGFITQRVQAAPCSDVIAPGRLARCPPGSSARAG